MLMSTVVVGLNLGRSIHAAQVNRDAGSLFSRGVDFSADFNKDILVRLAQGLGITRTGGTGVIMFSKVTWLPQSKCTSLNLAGCNAEKHVIVQRLTIGDTALRASSVGAPATNLIDSKGLINNYMVDDSTIATFPWMQLSENEFAYVAETYFSSPDFDLFGFQEGTGVYSISVY